MTMKTLLSTVLLLQVADVSGLGREGDVLAASSLDGPKRLWPVGELIPWWITSTESYEGQTPISQGDARILYAIRHFEEKTCLRFVACASLAECEAKPMYIDFWSGNGCTAPIGPQSGRNRISLAPNCGERAAVHEIGHNVGLDHEQKRRDRDDFISVNTDAIQAAKLSQFTKMYNGRDLGKYDYRGIMHYAMWAFQIATGQISITAPFRLIGTIGGLSEGDVAALDFMYNKCSKQYTEPTCMASIDTEVTHVIPQDKPFLVTFASNYMPEENPDVELTVSYDASTLPESANVVYEYKDTGMKFRNGGAHSLITYTPSAAEAGETHALAMTVSVGGVPLKTCYAYVRVATTNTVCFGKEANDPFVCSGRGTCTGDVMQPCACAGGFGGPECEGDADCPSNVVNSFDANVGDWAHGYSCELDATHKVGATGSSLRMGHPDFLGASGDDAILPLWSLSRPTRVSFDLAKFNTDLGGFSGVSFSVEPFQAGTSRCFEVSGHATGSRDSPAPYVWSASNPSTGIVSTTSWTIVPDQFYHFDVAFDFNTMTAVVSIDGVQEFTTSFNPACTTGFDTVRATGHGWLDNFDMHCTDFESPQHPETESPPATPRPTPRPTPMPTLRPEQCAEYVEYEEAGTVDRPEGDGGHARGDKDCRKLMCGGTLEVTFTLLDTQNANNAVTLYSYDSEGNEVVIGVYYGQTLPAPVSVWGNVLVRFVTDGFPFCPGSCPPNPYKGYTLTWTCQTTDSPTATPAPQTYVPTPAPPTAEPTAEPTIAPTPVPETFAPVAFPTFCQDSYLYDLRVGNVVHGLSGYKTNEEFCFMIQCNKHVSLNWLSMSTQEDHDFVRLYTLESGSYVEAAVHTGTTVPAGSQLPGYVLVRFSSDDSVSGDGFAIEYICEDAVPTPEPVPTPVPAPTLPFPAFCAVENTETDLIGDFQHPAVFGDDYKSNEEWCWMLPCNEQVTLTWVRFNTEADYDYVYVYTRDMNGDFVEVSQHSGSAAPASQTYSGDVLVRFSSDSSVVANGFAVDYKCAAVTPSPPVTPAPTPSPPVTPVPTPSPPSSFPAVCATEITETDLVGDFQHPAVFGDDYQSNEEWCWLIPCNEQVTLTWVRFDTEVDYDYVYVSDRNANGDFVQVSQHSGTTTPSVSTHTGDVLVRFSSDPYVFGKGFALGYECAVAVPPTPPAFEFPSYCAGHGETLTPGTLQHPAPPATSYANSENKCWHLECDGNVRLTWVSFSTESGYDKVYVYSVPVGADAAATYQGTSTPTSMDVAGGALVYFSSDSSVVQDGFELTWTCLAEI